MASPFAQAQLATEPEVAANLPDWLVAARAANRAGFIASELPAAREERWKYTSLKGLSQRALAARDPDADTRAVDPAAFALPGVDGPRIVFVNGRMRADLSTLQALPRGLVVQSLAEAHAAIDASAQHMLSRSYIASDEGVARLGAALAREGVLLKVEAGEVIAAPLHLVFAGAPADADIGWHARVLLQLGEGARLTLVEHHLDAAAAAHAGNVLADVRLASRAQLDWLRLQLLGEQATLIARTDVALAEAAALKQVSLDLGAQLARHDLRVALDGAGASITTRGVFALRGRQHADTQLDVAHGARDTRCDLAARGIADQRARGVFQGRIVVAAGADGADARLENKNLLLSPHAEIDTQPVLEILADEVKASHGATVGQLDEQALFYLRSRGVTAEQARALLTFAFCRAMLDAVAIPPLRDYLAALLLARLPQQESVA